MERKKQGQGQNQGQQQRQGQNQSQGSSRGRVRTLRRGKTAPQDRTSTSKMIRGPAQFTLTTKITLRNLVTLVTDITFQGLPLIRDLEM